MISSSNWINQQMKVRKVLCPVCQARGQQRKVFSVFALHCLEHLAALLSVPLPRICLSLDCLSQPQQRGLTQSACPGTRQHLISRHSAHLGYIRLNCRWIVIKIVHYFYINVWSMWQEEREKSCVSMIINMFIFICLCHWLHRLCEVEIVERRTGMEWPALRWQTWHNFGKLQFKDSFRRRSRKEQRTRFSKNSLFLSELELRSGLKIWNRTSLGWKEHS